MTDKITPVPQPTPAATPSEADIERVSASINLQDPTPSVAYGADAMKNIATFADSMLDNIKTKDAGAIGGDLTNLMLKVKGVEIDALGKKGIMERVPLIGSLFNSAKRTMAQFQSLSEQVEQISLTLENSMVDLIREVQMLERLYSHNQEFHQELSLYIDAGQRHLEKARAEELPRLQKEAETSTDSMAAQKVRDYAEAINRFERRLHDLQLSRTITQQTAPQIRLIQSNNQALAEKIQTSILSTIPIWKSQMVLALSLQGQQHAAAMQKEVSETTNSLLKKNAEMLKTATISTAREVERSVVDIETVREVQSQLIATIEETLHIAQEGRERRVAVEKELITMEHDLKTKLTSLAATSRTNVITAAAKTAIK